MRILTIFSLLLFSAVATFAQRSLSAKAGADYSYVRHVDNDFSLGYYLGAVYQEKITDVVTVLAEGYYLDQRYSVADVNATVKSANFVFGVNLFLPGTQLYLTAAPEIGHTFKISVDENEVKTDDRFRFGYVAGLGYNIERFGIHARYVGEINNQQNGFDWNAQLGISYRLFSF